MDSPMEHKRESHSAAQSPTAASADDESNLNCGALLRDEAPLLLQHDVPATAAARGETTSEDVPETLSEDHRLSVVSARPSSTSDAQESVHLPHMCAVSGISHNTSGSSVKALRIPVAVRGRGPSSGNTAGHLPRRPYDKERYPRSISPSLVRSKSTNGRSMIRSASKPELHSCNKGKGEKTTAKPLGARGKGLHPSSGNSTSNAPPRFPHPVGPLPGAKSASGPTKVGRLANQVKTTPLPERLKRPPVLIPARKLDPKQIKEMVRRWYMFDKRGKMSIIQVIVTTDKALVLNAERANEPEVEGFIKALKSRLSDVGDESTRVTSPETAPFASPPCVEGNLQNASERVDLAAFSKNVIQPDSSYSQYNNTGSLDGPLHPVHATSEEELELKRTDLAAAMPGSAYEAMESELPYELKVLETCLDHISASLDEAVSNLESESTSALDALALRVTAGHLDAVRLVKNRMVRLNTRVETVRTLLEKYLADDADLAELHLSGQKILEAKRAEQQRLREERRAERLDRYEAKRQRRLDEDPNASDPSSVSNSTFSLTDDDDGWLSSRAEMVIEPYFMSLDSTWSRLQAFGEFIEDTEDYVNITQDLHRNQLIQVELLLTAATFCVGLVTLIAGLFGMNLRSGLDTSPDDGGNSGGEDSAAFILVSVLSCVVAVGLLFMFIVVMRMKQLAFI